MSAPKWAHEIAEQLIDDIESRKGLGDEWVQIDPDIQDEIVETWASLIAAAAPTDRHPPSRERG